MPPLSFSANLFNLKWLWLAMDNFWDQILAVLHTLVEILMFLPNLVVEKSKELWLAMENLWAQILAVLHTLVMFLPNLVVEKSKELWLAMEHLWAQILATLYSLVGKLNLVAEKAKELWLALVNFWPTLVEKLKQLPLVIAHLWDQCTAWFDRVLPPEKRPEFIRRLIHIAIPILVALAAVYTVYLFGHFWINVMKCLWRGICRVITGLWRGLSWVIIGLWRGISWVMKIFRCRGRYGMMKAPGRNVWMPRNVFEADPRGYFLKLRAHPGDHLC